MVSNQLHLSNQEAAVQPGLSLSMVSPLSTCLCPVSISLLGVNVASLSLHCLNRRIKHQQSDPLLPKILLLQVSTI